MKNNKGFGAIEALLIVVIIGILGFTGWYVWNSHKKTNSIYNAANQVNSSTTTYPKGSAKKKPAVDPTADWVAYSSKEGQYSLKYPKTWVTFAEPKLCTEGLLLLGADSKSVGTCGSENFGQISIVSTSGDSQKDSELSTATSGIGDLGFKDIVTTSVTLNGVKGEKQTGTSTGADIQGPPTLPKDTKVTKYIFYTNNRTYVAKYVSGDYNSKAYPDAMSDFDTMVTKTLKFSAS